MQSVRLALAHSLRSALVAIALVGPSVGCADSHGRDPHEGDDGGSMALDGGSAPLDSSVGVDAAIGFDAGPRGSCDADDAHGEICRDVLCDGPGTWHWNGDSCFWIDCGACEGEDCGRSFSSEEACRAAHATCEATLCRDTGGSWMFWAEECEHFTCGRPAPAVCVVGRPVCDCGPHMAFDPASGCVPADCPELPPLPREQLCTSTGGAWEPICCDTTCGDFCAAACLAPACNCGPGHVMDAVRGCIESVECFERARGESCDPRARCEGNTICCDRCGGAGCAGTPTCVDPTCDVDPHTDSCGNRDDAL